MMTRTLTAAGLTAALALGAGSANAQPSEQIRIVGSSTVYPFSSYVAEEFGQTTRYPTPVVESTGSGGGLKLFTAGAGSDTPSITNASRKIKSSEFERAQQNNVGNITEAVIGYDGIAFAQSKTNPAINLTLEQLTLAVAEEVPNRNGDGLMKNPYTRWNQIDNSLPNRPIKVYGPPTTSGTRDAFEELVMEKATEHMKGYSEGYTNIRQDGVWIDAGENDNLIVQKLQNDREAFGVFGYSFLEENTDKIAGATINGVAPKPETISSGEYPVSRSLFFYIKDDHVRQVPGLMDYVQLFMSEKMIGTDGQLKKIGLVPLPDNMREASRQRVMNLVPLEMKNGNVSTLEEYAQENGFMKGRQAMGATH